MARKLQPVRGCSKCIKERNLFAISHNFFLTSQTHEKQIKSNFLKLPIPSASLDARAHKSSQSRCGEISLSALESYAGDLVQLQRLLDTDLL